MLNVWYIYLFLLVVLGVNVGKYTMPYIEHLGFLRFDSYTRAATQSTQRRLRPRRSRPRPRPRPGHAATGQRSRRNVDGTETGRLAEVLYATGEGGGRDMGSPYKWPKNGGNWSEISLLIVLFFRVL